MQNDTFEMSTGQAHEFAMACGRNGLTHADVKKICEGATLADFRKVVRGHASIVVAQHVIDLDAEPFVPDGWSVDEHRKDGQFTWDSAKTGLYLSKAQKSGKWVEGNKLRKELAERPVFNANLLDYLLKHPHLIPEEWKGKYVFFWGTIYRNSSGYLRVRCLCFGWDGWYWDYRWLDHDWRDDRPAALRAS